MDSNNVVPVDDLVNGDVSQMEMINNRVDEIAGKVDQLEQKLNVVEKFYSGSNTKQSKGGLKEKEKEKLIASFKQRQQDAARREAAGAKRMQDLIRQCASIVHQITQEKWAEPFMEPVDVVGLELHDYYEVIEKPMDFSTIQSKMEATDGTGYKHVREMCADVRLIFKNAIKYNDAKEDVHIMAQSLLDKFETKWLQLLPKVADEERRCKEEAAQLQLDMKLTQEVSHAKMARELSYDLDEVDMQLEEIRRMALQNCRKITTEEKKRLHSALTKLSSDNLIKALEIVAQNNSDVQAADGAVEFDVDALSISALWKLKIYVKDALQAQKMNGGGGININGDNTNQNNNNNSNSNNNKRKRENSTVTVKNSQKRTKRNTN